MTDRNEGHRPKRRRILAQWILLLALIWIGFTAVSWVMGRQAVERYCTGLEPGTDVAMARERARQEGLRFPARDVERITEEGMIPVTSSDVFGRYVCEVRHDGRTVTGASLRFSD